MSSKEDRARQAMYRASFGVLAGYLPGEAALRAWQRALKETCAEARGTAPRKRSVTALAALIESDGIVRMYVDEMIHEVPPEHRTVDDIPELLAQLDHILGIAPEWQTDPDKRNFFPLSALFTDMMITPAGYTAFRLPGFNDALRAILKEWCCFLDSENSAYVLNEGENGWLSEPAQAYNKLGEFVIRNRNAMHWGWTSYNAYFHREIKPECRPVTEPNDPQAIVSPNDGSVYRIDRGVDAKTRFWIKEEPY